MSGRLLAKARRQNVLVLVAASLAVGTALIAISSVYADIVTGISYIDVGEFDVTATSNTSGYVERSLTFRTDTLDRLDEASGGHGTNPNVGGMWLAENGADPNPHVTFDMKSEFNLKEIRIWNWNEGVTINRGTRDFEVRVAGSDGVYGPVVLNDTLAVGPGVGGIDGTPAEGGVDYSESFPLVASGVQFVRIFPLNNHGDGFGTGLAEVRIREIPEPVATTLALAGLVTFGLRRLRRRA